MHVAEDELCEVLDLLDDGIRQAYVGRSDGPSTKLVSSRSLLKRPMDKTVNSEAGLWSGIAQLLMRTVGYAGCSCPLRETEGRLRARSVLRAIGQELIEPGLLELGYDWVSL